MIIVARVLNCSKRVARRVMRYMLRCRRKLGSVNVVLGRALNVKLNHLYGEIQKALLEIRREPGMSASWLLCGLSLPCGFAGFSLATGDIEEGWTITSLYFIYAISMIGLLHGIFFIANRLLKEAPSVHRRRMPKYLEYAYTAVIAFGLTQVLFSASRIADYVTFVAGNASEITAEIKSVAQGYLDNECKIKKVRFTEEFCEKVKKIVEAENLRDYAATVVAQDKEFMTHIIDVIAAGNAPPARIVSPIVSRVRQLNTIIQYSKVDPGSAYAANVYAWLGLLILPFGIGLRLVKTSLELFGELETQYPIIKQVEP